MGFILLCMMLLFLFFCSYQGFLFCPPRKCNAMVRLHPTLSANNVQSLTQLIFCCCYFWQDELLWNYFLQEFASHILPSEVEWWFPCTVKFFFFNFQCFLLKIVYHFRKREFIKILQQIYDTLKMRALMFHKETLLNSAELKTTIRDGYPEEWRPP